ncbi:hypothetical protein POM88_026832 [Heracleum sosnowskyi]|uniref:Uncharacterized protein n=1 Tax=Heracleum sosnowskyi TaxID=360622 RepID=A0AAD8MQG4_9APIA|nr:hypothetical protein POM88_026832 [Heracleum sosnowskyi]
MSKRKEIKSYFQPKKKQTTTCEDKEPSAASIEVTRDGIEPLIFGGINSNSKQYPQNPEIVNEGIDSENIDEIIDFNSLIRDPAHQLQLALVAATREVPYIHTFFQNRVFIINAVTSSSKRHDELQANQIAEIEHLKEIEEIQTGKGLNQIGTLQRPGDTRWSSHFTAICSLIRMYGATRSVLIGVAAQGTTFSQRERRAHLK